MKISKVEIENFRSIEKLSFNLNDYIVLIGENNSGKSSILKAIELFYSESTRSFDNENFHFKNYEKPIKVIITYNQLTDQEKEQKYLKHWIYNNELKVKRVIEYDNEKDKVKTQLFGWQQKPTEEYFDLSQFDIFKSNVSSIVTEKGLPDYFKNDSGRVTQTSYKEGIQKHIEAGLVEMGDPDWIPNPGGLSENFASLLPNFYLVPALKDASDESKITQNTTLGKLINDLTNRIITINPQFQAVKEQLEGLKKFLNRKDNGDDSERLQEIKDLETILSDTISENIPNSQVQLEIVTPELIDLFKETKITIDDSIPTSISNKGHGLQRALVFSYIRAYAKILNEFQEGEETIRRNFILAIEEPEIYLHPNGQRKMMKVLKDISQQDQVIMSSHSSFFVDMFNYPKIAIIRRTNNGPATSVQYLGDIFEDENQKKTYRYLSYFDISRSELFFARKVILVEGETEKQLIPYWASKLTEQRNGLDFSSLNICVTNCGGKTTFTAFMKVMNNLKIPYVVLHDVDPIDFPENKENKTDKEQHEFRMFKENEKIETLLDQTIGRIIKINPNLEPIIGVSQSQADKQGKVRAAYNKYDSLSIEDYPEKLLNLMNLLIDWDSVNKIVEIN